MNKRLINDQGSKYSKELKYKRQTNPNQTTTKIYVVGLVNIENKNTILPSKHLNVIIIRAL